MPMLRHAIDQARLFAHRARWAGDVRTLRRLYRPQPGLQRITARVAGVKQPFWVRGGTMDATIAELVLCDASEYRVPVDIEPEVICDVGANIGATSVYFALRYPNARIVCFEPLPENLDVLHRNLAPFADRVTIVPAGLGARPGTFTYHYSDDPANLGGGTFCGIGCDAMRSVKLPVTTLADALRACGVDKIDLLKLDAEGAEHGILLGTRRDVLANVEVVIGELHGVNDWEVCELLSGTHQLSMNKALGRSCFPFVAVRKSAATTVALRRAA